MSGRENEKGRQNAGTSDTSCPPILAVINTTFLYTTNYCSMILIDLRRMGWALSKDGVTALMMISPLVK